MEFSIGQEGARRRRALAITSRHAAAVWAMFLVSGCSAYLHDPERAAATAELKSKFTALSTPAYFEAQEKNLGEFGKREDQAVAEFLVASRDYRLLNVIQPAADTRRERRKRDRLAGFIREDLRNAYGRDVLEEEDLKRFTSARYGGRLAAGTMEANRNRVKTVVTAYRAAQGKMATGCDAVLANPGAEHSDPQQAKTYLGLAKACAQLRKREDRLNGCKPTPAGGAFAEVCARIDEIANDSANEKRKAELLAAENALKQAMLAQKPDNAELASQRAQGFLDSIGDMPTNERLNAVLTELETIFGSEFEKAVGEMNQTGKAALAKYGDPLVKALIFLEAVEGVADAERAAPADKSSALLIGLAKIRHDLNLVNIDIAAAEAERALLREQVGALQTQIFYLGRAQSSLAGNGPSVLDDALNHFVYSTNEGRIPFEIGQFRLIQLKRSTALKHAKATEADYRALLQPAIDQLAAYGAGGIKPETIAGLLAELPVAIPLIAE